MTLDTGVAGVTMRIRTIQRGYKTYVSTDTSRVAKAHEGVGLYLW